MTEAMPLHLFLAFFDITHINVPKPENNGIHPVLKQRKLLFLILRNGVTVRNLQKGPFSKSGAKKIIMSQIFSLVKRPNRGVGVRGGFGKRQDFFRFFLLWNPSPRSGFSYHVDFLEVTLMLISILLKCNVLTAAEVFHIGAIFQFSFQSFPLMALIMEAH